MKIRINCHNDVYFLVTKLCLNILVLAPWRISSIMNVYLRNLEDKTKSAEAKKFKLLMYVVPNVIQ